MHLGGSQGGNTQDAEELVSGGLVHASLHIADCSGSRLMSNLKELKPTGLPADETSILPRYELALRKYA